MTSISSTTEIVDEFGYLMMIFTYEFNPKASPKKSNEVITRFASLDFFC